MNRKLAAAVFGMALVLAPAVAFASGQSEGSTSGSATPTVNVYRTVSHSAGSELGSDKTVIQQVRAYFKQRTGVDVIVSRVPDTDYLQQITLVLNSGKPVNVILGIDWTQLQPEGVLAPINDVLAKYGPHVKTGKPQSAWNHMMTPDGKIWGIPRLVPTVHYPIYVRQNWLDKYNLQQPKSVDDLDHILQVFKQNDPAGNGSTIDLLTYPSWLENNLLGAFTKYGNSVWLDPSDGKIKPAQLQPGYEDFLARMHDWYQKGYIYPESFTDNSSEIRKVFTQGKVGVTATWYSVVTIGLPTVRQNFPNADYYLATLTGPKGKAETIDNGGTGAQVFTASSTPEQLAGAMKVFDLQYADPSAYATGYVGIEGQNWKWVNKDQSLIALIGKQKFFEDYRFAEGIPQENEAMIVDNPSNPVLTPHQNYLKNLITDFSGAKYTFDKDINWDMPKIREAVPSLSDLKTLWQQGMVQFITGARPLSQYNDWVQEMYKAGLDKWIAEYTRQYNALTNK